MDGSSDKKVDQVRRKLLKTSVVVGGALAAGQLPYTRPEVKSFFGTSTAYAQATPVFSIACTAVATATGGPGTACQNAVIQNLSAQVTPIPPVGTLLRCTPSTDDPANSTLPTVSSTTVPTDAAGVATFVSLDLTGSVPNPLLAIGSVLTMEVRFEDQATFGTATCTNLFTIVACP